ncbi:MAG: MATE family efflux transporter [Haloglomus sp.]
MLFVVLVGALLARLADLIAAVGTRLREAAMRFPAALARAGLVERDRADRAFDLALPVMVTGGLRVALRVSDFVFVGLATGAVGIAALELGFQYYFVAFGVSLALTSGTISVVSRLTGADEPARADLAVKQSLWLALAIAVPLTAVSWFYARPLLDLLAPDAETARVGAEYLRIVMLSMAPRFWSMIAARALAGAGDTRTPMYVRLLTLPTNIVLNAVLVFGLGPAPPLGVAGAAIATAVANTAGATVFAAVFLSGRWPVRLRVGGPQFDRGLAAEIVRVAAPLGGTRLSRTFGRFPFLFVLGVLGTPYVAAYAVGRRVVLFALMPAWGYATAASTLVGQAVGAGDEETATRDGWATVRVALATQLLVALLLAVLAAPIATLFGTENLLLTAEFVRVFALGVAGFAISRTTRGALRGAGDTRWPLYGTLLGTYVFRLPIAFLALPVGYAVALGPFSVTPGRGLGVVAIYAAILIDFYAKAVVNAARFATGRWKAVARTASVGVRND